MRYEGRCVSECPTRWLPIEEISRGNAPAEDGSASTTTTTVNTQTLNVDEGATEEPPSAFEAAITENAQQAQAVVPALSEAEAEAQTPANVPLNPEAQAVIPVLSEPETGEQTPPNVPVNAEAQEVVPVASVQPEAGERTLLNIALIPEALETSEAPPSSGVYLAGGGNEGFNSRTLLGK